MSVELAVGECEEAERFLIGAIGSICMLGSSWKSLLTMDDKTIEPYPD